MISFDRDEDPQRIPQSWADHGLEEIARAGERRCYAIRAAPGHTTRDPEYVVNGNGHRPRERTVEPQLEILYVTADLLRAHSVRVDCQREAGEVRPTDGFANVRAFRPDLLGAVDDFWSRWAYRRDLVALYGADAIAAPDTEPEAAFATGSELRADGGESR